VVNEARCVLIRLPRALWPGLVAGEVTGCLRKIRQARCRFCPRVEWSLGLCVGHVRGTPGIVIHYGPENSTVDQAPPDHQVRDEPQLFVDAPMPRASQLAALRIPEPQFPTKTPAGRRPSRPMPVRAPVVQPDPSDRAGRPGVEQLRWARCPDDGRLHLLQPAGVDLAAASGHAQAVCGHRVPAQGLTINGVPSGALCMACVIGATS
jgi:hypothetical protein